MFSRTFSLSLSLSLSLSHSLSLPLFFVRVRGVCRRERCGVWVINGVQGRVVGAVCVRAAASGPPPSPLPPARGRRGGGGLSLSLSVSLSCSAGPPPPWPTRDRDCSCARACNVNCIHSTDYTINTHTSQIKRRIQLEEDYVGACCMSSGTHSKSMISLVHRYHARPMLRCLVQHARRPSG